MVPSYIEKNSGGARFHDCFNGFSVSPDLPSMNEGV
jgi:hypothetical protein